MTHSPNKIAVVVPKYGLVGGAEHVVSELTERIALSSKYEIHVFANKWVQLSDRIKFHNVPVIAFPKFLTTISFAYFARKKIARMEFDIDSCSRQDLRRRYLYYAWHSTPDVG